MLEVLFVFLDVRRILLGSSVGGGRGRGGAGSSANIHLRGPLSG